MTEGSELSTRRVLAPDDHAALVAAFARLEHPGLAVRLSAMLGTPVARGYDLLPRDWREALQARIDRAMATALAVALRDLETAPPPSRQRTRLMALGAAGGLLGWPALVVELPATTVMLLRAIAAAAREEGEDLTTADAKIACFEVFALGGPREGDDDAELGFYELRAAAALHLTGLRPNAFTAPAELPAVAAFLRAVARRFGVVMGEKAAAQAVPLLGAGAGAAINALFFEHFREVALGHFALRRLERHYGEDVVRAAYAELAAAERQRRHAAFGAAHDRG